MTPSEPPLINIEPGYKLDRYELLAPYARGGMASVWLGRVRGKHGFERIVAIKTILPEYASDPDFRTMLLDEARIASAVEHPNVAQTLDVGEEHGIVYLVLEWVDGDSLYTLHRLAEKQKRFIPTRIVLRTLADACRGLHAAHELKDRTGQPLTVVHRDLSPHNILVNASGVAKLIDFGVAKAQGRFGNNTSAGIIKGKVRFMAPEQALGKELDRRADIWSMGATMQYLLTGTHPYTGSNDVEVLLAISRGDAPKPLPSSIHSAISDVVARSLAPDPKDRYQTAASLARAIEVAMGLANCRAAASDVTEFLQTSCRPLLERREKAVELALQAAEGRAKYNELLQPLAAPGSGPGAGSQSGQRSRPGLAPPSLPDISVDVPSNASARMLQPQREGTGPSAAAIPIPPQPVAPSPPARSMGLVAALAAIATVVVIAIVAGIAWQLRPSPVVVVAPASSIPAPVTSASAVAAEPTAEPPAISIDDLPPAPADSEKPVAATAIPRTGIVPPRPVVAGPPPVVAPPPPKPTATATSDRQRNFGF